MMSDIVEGLTSASETTVGDSNTAKRQGSGNLDVFATPAMVALMENAASRAVAPYLPEGKDTVGTMINVSHDRATGMGDTVVATAVLTAVDGRKLTFEVSAADSGGEIGKGVHNRFIIDVEKFMSKVKK